MNIVTDSEFIGQYNYHTIIGISPNTTLFMGPPIYNPFAAAEYYKNTEMILSS